MTSQKIILFYTFLYLCVVTCHYHHHSNSQYSEIRNLSSASTLKNTTLERSKLKVSVFYETLCPASVTFFTSQLRPTVEKLSSYVNVHLVPYGHARTRQMHGRYRFRCQHGPAECYGNKLHACAIEVIQNNTKSVLLNACLMQYSVYRTDIGYDYSSALNWCGYKLDIPIDSIRICVNSEQGNRLLTRYGAETYRLRPDYVPYVLLDDSADNQDEATRNLIYTICQKLEPTPAICIN